MNMHFAIIQMTIDTHGALVNIVYMKFSFYRILCLEILLKIELPITLFLLELKHVLSQELC